MALVLLRVAQGFGVGGEWGGAVLMAVEHAPPGKRGFYGSWPQIGVPAGLLLSTAVFTAFSRLPEEQFLAWGWRVPFLLSIAARRRRPAHPDAHPRDAGVRARQRDAQRKRGSRSSKCSARIRSEVLLAMGARFAENGAFYIYSVFVLVYATQQVKIDRSRSCSTAILFARRVRAGGDSVLRRAVGSARTPAGVSVRRGHDRACSPIRCSGCSTPDRRPWSCWR